jgi:NAD(P)-dependent dehydrogenase (short-subunit alcohol dehydrogenase family)
MRRTVPVAAITGGSGGIGRGIALRLAAAGAVVAVAARSEEGGRVTVAQIESAGGRATFTRVDVTDMEQVHHWLVETASVHGGIDWLVNNAGTNGRSARIEDCTVEEFSRVLLTNLQSAFYALRTCIPIMRAQSCGSIVNIGSTASVQGYGNLGAYTASKHDCSDLRAPLHSRTQTFLSG